MITETEESITPEALAESAAKLLPVNTLLVALYGATVGRIGVLGIEAATNQAVCYIIPDKRRADRKYLYYALQSKVPVWLTQRVGGGQPNISQGIIKDTKIPLPPLPEQKRIADILDKADAIRRKRQEARFLAEEIAKATFANLFDKRADWPVEPLNDLLDEGDTINYGIVQPGQDVEGGVPIIRICNFRDMVVEKNNLLRVAPAVEKKHHRSRIRGNEVLLACVGSIGEIAVADETLRGFNINRAVARIPLGSRLLPPFLAFYLKSGVVQTYFGKEVRTGSQIRINIKQIGEMPIPVPPIATQQRFADYHRKHREILRLMDQSQCEANALFSSLVQRAFKGEL